MVSSHQKLEIFSIDIGIVCFRWINPILKLGMSREISEDDIYDVTNEMRSDKNTEALAKQWQLELKCKNPSILRALLKLYGPKVLLISGLCAIGATTLK